MRRFDSLLVISSLVLSGICAGCAGSGPATRTPNTARGQTRAFDAETQARIDAVDRIVKRVAKDYRLDPDLLRGMIWVESRFNPKATSPAGAKRLMQLMPATAKSLAEQLNRRSRPYNAEFYVTAGAHYLRKMIDGFDGDLKLALAAYNAGPGNVRKWTRGGRRLPERSRSYVDKVIEARGYFTDRRLKTRRLAAAATLPAAAPTTAPAPATVAGANVPATPATPAAPTAVPPAPTPAAAPAPAPALALDAQARGNETLDEPVFERRPELDMRPAPSSRDEGERGSIEAHPATLATNLENSTAPEAPAVGRGILPSVLD